MDRKVGVVMTVRNEEASIADAVLSLDEQEEPPTLVVVVDDGSSDRTGEILQSVSPRKFAMRVVTLPHHSQSYVGRPELARSLNAGLRVIRSHEPRVDFVMKLDGDHRLPRDCLRRLLDEMQRDPRLAVASGWIEGEPFNPSAPRGSGMMVSADFWMRASAMQFPLVYGWESWVYLKAMSQGFRTRSFRDIRSAVSRKTSVLKGVLFGRAMYALGYDPVFAAGRCFLFMLESPAAGLQMWRGYIDHRGVERTDVAEWVASRQRRTLVRRVGGILAHAGRR